MSSRIKWTGALLILNLLVCIVGRNCGEDKKCEKEICVGLVFDVGGLGDKSFNDAAYRGLRKAERDFGIGIQYVEPGDGSDRESALRQLVQSGSELVFGVGFIFSDDLRKLSVDFPDTKFAGIDYAPSPKEEPRDNLLGLRFREHEGSFLVGALAALMSKNKKIGFVGGMDIPLIHKFESGYRAGANHVCPECEVYSSYCGNEPKAFNDPIKGKELTLAQISRGADVVFHASGKSGTGVFSATKERDIWAIGIDSDQFDEAPCCVLTSMIKNVDVTVYDTIAELVKGAFESGVKEYGLAEEGVGYVYDKNNDKRIPPEVKSQLDTLTKLIVRKELQVPWK